MTIETYLVDLSNYIQSNGLGTVAVDIVISGYYDKAGNAIFVTPYGGSDNCEIKTPGYDDPCTPDVQFLVRNLDQAIAISKANAIFKLFRKVSDLTIGDTKIISMRAKGPPSFVMKTNSLHYHYSINFSLIIQ
ncbi:MAG: hypothetical protein HF308_18945 [Ignavibacteria bacterium]|nr:hypothetical protein [Ignavibacteria bacterium]